MPGRRLRRLLSGLLLMGAAAAPARAADPRRLDHLLPERPAFTIEHRTRYERLNDPFRAGSGGDQDLLALRTLVHARATVLPQLVLGAERFDARACLDDAPLDTGIVNAVERKLYVALALDDGGGRAPGAGRAHHHGRG